MKLPHLSYNPGKNRQQIIRFGGVRYGEGASPGELSESLGLSSERFPALSQRAGRKTAGTYESPTGLYARGALCVVDGTSLLYDGEVVGAVEPGEKQFAAINTKIVIFPDKVYFDTSTKEFGPLAAEYLAYPNTLVFSADTLTIPASCYYDAEGAIAEDGPWAEDMSFTVYASAAVNAEDGTLTMGDSSVKAVPLLAAGDILLYGCGEKQYREVTGCEARDGGYVIQYRTHTSTHHVYQRLDEVFFPGDAVEISGCETYPANNRTAVVKEASETTLTFGAETFEAGDEQGAVTIRRRVPDLSCICECDNRIWGAEGNVIYASALGDPKNFFVYDGVATDSYAVAVGTDGDFSGCIAYGGSVLFWKEHCVHKVLGTMPANYEIYTYYVQGVQQGSEKSMAVINETLFYKGRNGVFAYTGGVPELLSENFGARQYYDAVAGTDGERYYVSMRDGAEEWGLWVFDTLRGVWLKEDDTHVSDFAYLDGVLYYLDAEKSAVVMAGQDDSEEGAFLWRADFAPFTEEISGRKCYSRLYFRLELSPGAWMRISLSCDGGPFTPAWETHNARKPTVTAYLRPTRCDSFRVRLEGKGRATVRSFVREFETGSEV